MASLTAGSGTLLGDVIISITLSVCVGVCVCFSVHVRDKEALSEQLQSLCNP